MSSFPRYYHSETIASEFVKFYQKMFWFNFIQFTVGYFNEYERFCNFKQTRWNYKTFIFTFFILLKLINYTVKETQWLISLRKLTLNQKDLFVKVWWYSFWTMKIIIDYISFMEFWRSMVKVVLCFSDKRWIYRHRWCRWVWCPKTYEDLLLW